jgi:DNA-binding response OmpR family regulator
MSIHRKILIADDDAFFLREASLHMAGRGYAVIPVGDGYQALEYALRERPDLLVLDVHMPCGDGFSVHERVIRHPELALAPVIFMTHDRSHAVAVEAARHHASTILYKPFELDELVAAVTRHLPDEQADAA